MIKIPLAPQLNLQCGCVCTPDGGLLYAGSRSINFISYVKDDNETPLIQCFHTRQFILSLDVDPHWGQTDRSGNDEDIIVAPYTNLNKSTAACVKEKESSKLFAVLFQDNSVQIWDFDKGCAIQGHKAHLDHIRHMVGNGPFPQQIGEVLISYMCNRNVLSVDNQDIVVYCVVSNSFYRRPMFVSPRNHQMTLLKCSPYNENHFAIGTKRGLVLLCDLQKMTTLYTLRGHDFSITSLAWNRVNFSENKLMRTAETPLKTSKTKAAKKQQRKAEMVARTDDTLDEDEIFDIYDYDYLDNEFGAPSKEMKLKSNFVSDFMGIEEQRESSTTAKFDFAEACQSLKEEINALRDERPQTSPEHIVSLEECKQAARNRGDELSSCGSDGNEADEKGRETSSDKVSSDDSLVRLTCHTPSSEESVDLDGTHCNKQQNIICQVEIHNSQSQHNDEIKDNKIIEGHLTEEDIQIISVREATEEEVIKRNKSEELYDILLVSISKDGTFCVWNATTGATCDTHKVRSRHGEKKFHISWISCTSLLINNMEGDLQLWCKQSLPKSHISQQCGFRPYKFVYNKRNWIQRSVASFACSSQQNVVWCISSHRVISMEDIMKNKTILNYSCVSTNIGAMQECPDDMNKIALGFSDHRIGIIDISKITPYIVHIENYSQLIASSVKSLVWSPDCKKIAYGTMEGRIGVINVEGSHKQTYTYNSACGKPIYSIKWQDKFIYVVSDERIAVYEDSSDNKDPYIIPDICGVSCISVRDNYLFVGTQNGQLRVYVHVSGTHFQYELLKSIDLGYRYISDISWSPIATNKLAIVSNANNVNVLDFNNETGDLKVTHKIKIDVATAANACVKWSNRNESYFLTCGFDGAVRVYDISKEKTPERFVKIFHCPMTCGLFLPTDEQIIVCSGKSASLEFVDIRENTKTTSAKSKRTKLRTLDTVKWATKAVTRNEVASQPVEKKLKCSLDKTQEDLYRIKSANYANVEGGVTNDEEVSTIFEKLYLQKIEKSPNSASIYMKNPLTLLYLTTKEINRDALDLMFTILNSPKINETKSLSAKLYGTKTEAKEVLADELKNHQNSKGVHSLFMPQLNGSLKEEILKCVQSKQLCEWHVSLAPSISYSFWYKCCQAFAEQLIEEGYALQAASYMLAIHRQQDAIEMLMEKKFFKEALLIARIYLQPEDQLNNIISEQWITHLHTVGNFTGAALLCLLTKQNNRAYEYLAKIRKSSPEIERVIQLLKPSSV